MYRHITDFAESTLHERYYLQDETWDKLVERVAEAGSLNDSKLKLRLIEYMKKLWFMPSTPILSNLGANRGLPISCFLNEAQDSLIGIQNTLNESWWLSAKGGGIGTYWSNLRAVGDSVNNAGATTGIIPFIQLLNAQTIAISQGALRRGSAAVYLNVSHPEIHEFLDLRRPSGGDPSRKALNLHHAVVIDDKFMRAVLSEDDSYNLISPKTKNPVKTIHARDLWVKILETRIETGEPYILFIDTVNNNKSPIQQALNLHIKTSNLCSEIVLPTGIDYKGKDRTAVCCLSSVNIEYYDEWKNDKRFIEDVMRFLDNVLEIFIRDAQSIQYMEKAVYSAMMERSVGLGAMGFHSYLQSKGVPFDGVMAKVYNEQIFKHIKEKADEASIYFGQLQACMDGVTANIRERFSNKIAIAPTASISIICGGTSPGIDPIVANIYTHKTLSGSFIVKNKYLERVLEKYGKNDKATWDSILGASGSVQHLTFLTDQEKDTFKTAHEIDQRWIIELASDRQKYVCQSQSVNLFLHANIHKRDLHGIHVMAWKKGLKSLYYCRSKSLQRMEKDDEHYVEQQVMNKTPIDYDECLACQ